MTQLSWKLLNKQIFQILYWSSCPCVFADSKEPVLVIHEEKFAKVNNDKTEATTAQEKETETKETKDGDKKSAEKPWTSNDDPEVRKYIYNIIGKCINACCKTIFFNTDLSNIWID